MMCLVTSNENPSALEGIWKLKAKRVCLKTATHRLNAVATLLVLVTSVVVARTSVLYSFAAVPCYRLVLVENC